jgi:two-component system chemotaxis response regulator CheY
MKTLIVEDDYITSQVMQEIMFNYGECDIAENGKIAIELFTQAFEQEQKYDLIFLDIMMPEMDGQDVLALIRQIEEQYGIKGLDGVKIIMSTALDDYANLSKAFGNQCEGYVVKPIEKEKVIKALRTAGLID